MAENNITENNTMNSGEKQEKKEKQKGGNVTKKRISPASILQSIWVIFVVCLYPCAFMYIQNFTESAIDKIVLPLFVFLFVAFVAFFINIIIFRNIHKTTVFTSIFMLMFMNFTLVQYIFAQYTNLPEKVFMIILVVLLLVVGVFLFITKKELDGVSFIIGFAFSGLIIMNVVMAIPKYIDSQKKNEEVKVEQYAQNDDFRENVYYIIMDEYGGKENLEYYYNYDNSDFLGYLNDKGFSISNSTHNYEGINTYDILPNLLNLDYIVSPKNTIISEYNRLTDPALYRFFKEAGYNVEMINHVQGLKSEGCDIIYESPTIEMLLNHLHDIDYYLLKNSFIGYLMMDTNLIKGEENPNQGDIYEDYRNEVLKILDLLEEQPKIKKEKPTFMICYMCFPHVPYVLKADGQPAERRVAYDATAKQSYIEQLQYLNSRLERIVDSIIENDPNAVIVLQGDHGAREGYHLMYQYSKSEYNEKVESEMMENPFNCVYWGRASKQDIEGLSGLNTWRVILNNLYGTNYKQIEVPQKYIHKWKYESDAR
ncbi:MAG: sulfatase-like hydrolase/transferase [Lachnospiraceae bacterium]|nr:sulfatase-like hydrolase/transferase [Lachnospiraceae bacterium]